MRKVMLLLLLLLFLLNDFAVFWQICGKKTEK